jgi:hypothetical protein
VLRKIERNEIHVLARDCGPSPLAAEILNARRTRFWITASRERRTQRFTRGVSNPAREQRRPRSP